LIVLLTICILYLVYNTDIHPLYITYAFMLRVKRRINIDYDDET
jgi:hypothetical protein